MTGRDIVLNSTLNPPPPTTTFVFDSVDFFSSLFSRTLTPTWSFACHGTLWRLLLGDRGVMVGECRDEEKKETVFFCLNEETGALVWHYAGLEEPWWVGLEAVCRNRVLLHGFETPDMPGHKRLIALDLDSGKEVWRNDEVTFWFSYQSRIYTYRTMFEKRIGQVLDLETGELLETLERIEDLTSLRQLAREEDPHASLDFPEVLDPGGAAPKFRPSIEREIRNQRLIGAIEAVIREPYLVMNYHREGKGSTPEKPLLENQFIIFDSASGKKVFSDVLIRNARVPVPDSFFIRNSSVFFIKDQKNLCMLRLPQISEGS